MLHLSPQRVTVAPALLLLAALGLPAGCGGAGPAEPSASADPTPVQAESPSNAQQSPPAGSSSDEALAGRTIALDPGHNGGNAANPDRINAAVPDGRGGTKACNTTGTATESGYPEHAFNWDVSQQVTLELKDRGADVVLSRSDDEGVGPCVDERGQFAGDSGADILISIHANGSEDPVARGFHMITVRDTEDERLEEASAAAAAHLFDAFEASGFEGNPAYGTDGIVRRTDIAGLNHAAVPAVLVECGEMRNSEDAAIMESAEGRELYADAIVSGIESILTEQ
ncbi:N-acetylmuramoyl-L-alanine amidase [Brevibacterium daeguense]|uniref:N-acetylmuramoyl-L-alanine amidase n=1 Tax=Brevibacterium daeguense TaxID=909936 RepID=A0ABP8EMY6_9MICO|nr:N-acetylmuramoyl-L-alanine amidase [Brevibacterium daeguense]